MKWILFNVMSLCFELNFFENRIGIIFDVISCDYF